MAKENDEDVDKEKQAKHKKSDNTDSPKKAKLSSIESNNSDSKTFQKGTKDESRTNAPDIPLKEVKDEEKLKLSGGLPSPIKSQSFKMFSALSPPTLVTTKPLSSVPVTTHSGISTFSPSSTDSLSPTFISLSTAQQISPKSTSIGSSMIPFPSKLSGVPSPNNAVNAALKSVTPSSHSASYTVYSSQVTNLNPPATISMAQPKTEMVHSLPSPVLKPQIAIQMGPPKMEPSFMAAAGIPMAQSPTGSYQIQRSRLGAVMQVRCKAVAAYLYVNKYESGSKGKCILLGDEWLTPNEFEEKSGSKAKKYLSSIKCLGRPLRSYVNSGELRGSGPPPSPKPPRMNKPKPPQAIAPAPAPGHLNMAQMGMPPPGMPNTHLSQSLPVAMMGSVSVSGQPILINQQSYSVANSINNTSLGQGNQIGTPILAPMTFTLAPMSGLDVRQNVGVQQQMHGGQHM